MDAQDGKVGRYCVISVQIFVRWLRQCIGSSVIEVQRISSTDWLKASAGYGPAALDSGEPTTPMDEGKLTRERSCLIRLIGFRDGPEFDHECGPVLKSERGKCLGGSTAIGVEKGKVGSRGRNVAIAEESDAA